MEKRKGKKKGIFLRTHEYVCSEGLEDEMKTMAGEQKEKWKFAKTFFFNFFFFSLTSPSI
jgi:hypothetical protein